MFVFVFADNAASWFWRMDSGFSVRLMEMEEEAEGEAEAAVLRGLGEK